MPVQTDDDGNVAFFAQRAAGQVAAQNTSAAVAFRGAKSGNNAFDPSSGRFQKKGGAPAPTGPALVNENPVPTQRSGIPQGITPEEWERRLDVVRLAARQFKAMDPTAAQSFLKDRVTDLSKVDINQFLTDVRAHQMDDLLDAFDAQLRKGKGGVKVTAPQAWVKGVFKSMTDVELSSLTTRLVARGFEAKKIAKTIAGKIGDQAIKGQLATQLKVKLEDDFSDEEDWSDFEFNDPEPEPERISLAEAVSQLAAKETPPPIVNVAPAQVTVEVPPAGPKRIVRDRVSGEIIGVEPGDAA